MKHRLRLLLLCPFAPRLDAPHGGRVTASLALRLAERHELALVCIRGEDEAPTDDDLRERCARVDEVVVRRPVSGRWSARVRQLAKPVRGLPNMVERAAAPPFADRVRAVAEAWRPDVVQIDLAETARHIHGLDNCHAPRILVDHEPGASAADDWSGTGTGLRRAWRKLDALAWRRFAADAFAQVDAVVVFTAPDADAVRAITPAARIEIIPLAIEVPDRPLDPLGDGETVLFFGGYEHPPNLDAALRLERSIFPGIRSRVPRARLSLVGADPTREMYELAGDSVEITGRVEAVEPHLDSAAVVVAPLRLGGGMRVKVLETLAAGKALVASPRALEGIAPPGDGSVLVADSDAEFVECVSGLLRDAARREALAAGARRWAVASLGWEPILDAYERLYRDLRADRE